MSARVNLGSWVAARTHPQPTTHRVVDAPPGSLKDGRRLVRLTGDGHQIQRSLTRISAVVVWSEANALHRTPPRIAPTKMPRTAAATSWVSPLRDSNCQLVVMAVADVDALAGYVTVLRPPVGCW